MSEEQAAQVLAISDSLNLKLAVVREEVRKAFEGGDIQQSVQRLQQITPMTEPGRTAINDALKAVEAVLTREQWRKIPERVRQPVQTGVGRRGGG